MNYYLEIKLGNKKTPKFSLGVWVRRSQLKRSVNTPHSTCSSSHPDFTVGPGMSPGLPKGSRALPPVGNFTQPQRDITDY
jgi:hypothetical protein